MADCVTRELAQWGAPRELCRLVDSAVHTEKQLNLDIHESHRDRTEDEIYDDEDLGNQGLVEKLLKQCKECYQKFKHILEDVNRLNDEANKLPEWKKPVANGSSPLKSPCDITTDKIQVSKGDPLEVVQNGRPYLVKVKTAGNKQGYLPVFSCTVPLPDRTAAGLTKRLHLHLAAAWLGTLKQYRAAISDVVSILSKELSSKRENVFHAGHDDGERIQRLLVLLSKVIHDQKKRASLQRTHDALYMLLGELEENNNETSEVYKRIDDVDKLVVYYQGLLKQWQQYRRTLRTSEVAIQIVDSLKHLKPRTDKIRVYELKITLDIEETREEITHVQSEEWSSSATNRTEQIEDVETGQITSARAEQNQKFVIRAVVDLRTDQEISLDEAIREGIVIPTIGMYKDLTTGDVYPIPVAMNAGYIKVESSTTKRSKEETKEFGVVTIKTLNEKRPYKLHQVIDPITGEKISVNDAISKKILDAKNAVYHNLSTEEEMPLFEAIQSGWVIAEFDENSPEPEFITKSYAIRAVVNQRDKKRVSFTEALKLGILEKETGTYVHNGTGERVFVGDAITRGFLKATELQADSGLDISEENRMVISKVNQIKKKFLKPLDVLNALKHAAK